jgi:acyl-CoA thioesterase FadM
MTNKYEYKTTVTIGDTNAMQNMYFLNFFKLQGIIRELWVKDCVTDGFNDLANGMLLITKDAQCDFIKDFFLYDEIKVVCYFSQINRTNVGLVFEYYSNTGELHAKGSQTIVFADHTHKIIKIPDNWRSATETYLIAP